MTGMRVDVRRDEYDQIERVNYSALKMIAKSPAHYAHGLTQRYSDTDAKKFGRAFHIAVLEPERFRSAVAVWDGGTRRGKEWDAFRAKHAQREILTESEYERCLALQKAVRGDAIASRYVSRGRAEVTMEWAINGVPCKGRIDFDSPEAIVDLKSTRDASPDGFGKESWRYRYHTQGAWYGDGYEASGGPRKPYVLIAAEHEPPYIVQVYRMPDIALDLGREEYRLWLDKLAYCREQNHWPGYVEGEQELTLPRWAVDFSEEDDIAALDLHISQGE